MTRTEQNAVTRAQSTATHLGWNLTFILETGGSNQTVTCNGHKPGSEPQNSPVPGGGSLSASMNSTTPSANINFHGIAYDAQLAADIFAEMEIILGGIV